MDLTQGSSQTKHKRAKKMMLWFGIISLTMSFAAWTSAFIVSSSRPDWLSDFELPKPFFYSVGIILVSSLTFIMAKRALKQGKHSLSSIWLWVTFGLGVVFIISQISGFQTIIDEGYNFTGPTSNITMSYIYLIAVMHILHVVIGLISILVVIYNHFKQKYSATNMLGFELSAIFWHFVDLLWVYLFLFLYFFR